MKFIIKEDLKKRKTLKKIPRAVRYQMTSFGGQFIKYLKDIAVRGRYVGKYKGGRKSGQLRRGIYSKIISFGSRQQLEFGTKGVKYASILEKGGTIRPVRKQYLTIPLPGVKGTARDYSDAFVIRSKKGNLLIVERKGKGLKPLFVLKKQVKIPAFRWMSKSYQDRYGKLDKMLSKPLLYRVAEKL